MVFALEFIVNSYREREREEREREREERERERDERERGERAHSPLVLLSRVHGYIATERAHRPWFGSQVHGI